MIFLQSFDCCAELEWLSCISCMLMILSRYLLSVDAWTSGCFWRLHIIDGTVRFLWNIHNRCYYTSSRDDSLCWWCALSECLQGTRLTYSKWQAWDEWEHPQYYVIPVLLAVPGIVGKWNQVVRPIVPGTPLVSWLFFCLFVHLLHLSWVPTVLEHMNCIVNLWC